MTTTITIQPARRRRVMGSRIPGLPHRQVSVLLTQAVFERVRDGAERHAVTFAEEARRLIALALKAEGDGGETRR